MIITLYLHSPQRRVAGIETQACILYEMQNISACPWLFWRLIRFHEAEYGDIVPVSCTFCAVNTDTGYSGHLVNNITLEEILSVGMIWARLDYQHGTSCTMRNCFLAENWEKRSIPLSYLYSKYEPTAQLPNTVTESWETDSLTVCKGPWPVQKLKCLKQHCGFWVGVRGTSWKNGFPSCMQQLISIHSSVYYQVSVKCETSDEQQPLQLQVAITRISWDVL